MLEELKLLPCPVCGSRDIDTIFGDDEMYSVDCGNCCMTGPADHFPDFAERAWNSIPRTLMWTKEPPKAPGLYGVLLHGDNIPSFVHLFTLPDSDLRKSAAYWLGPLPSFFNLADAVPEPDEPHA